MFLTTIPVADFTDMPLTRAFYKEVMWASNNKYITGKTNGARDEKYTPSDRDKFDPFRYRFGLVDRGGTGRFLFGVRWYDPSQGVWVQQDSLDAPFDPVNANRYGYAGGDPVNNWDPSGYAMQGGLNVCFVACINIGLTVDRETGDSNLNLGLGIGPRESAEAYLGHTGSAPSSEISGGSSFTCGASLGVGYSGGFSIDPMAQSADGQSNLIFGEDIGCSGMLNVNIPAP